MQQHPNNDLRRLPSEKGKGIAGTVIIHIAVLLLLVLFSFTVPPPPIIEEGILVNFGTDETGFGEIEPSDASIPEETSPPPARQAAVQSEDEPLLTQDTEDAPEVKKVDPEAEKKKREKIEADKKIRAEREAERKVKEEEEKLRKQAEADQKREADIKNKTKNAFANAKNTGTSSTSEGVAGGAGNQGDPKGDLNSTVRGPGSGTGTQGISYSLQGRGSQSLPNPKYDIQQEGRVVVDVSVDREGRVTQAVPGVKGSTTLDDDLLKVAKEAALKARFEAKADAPMIQKGTITYNFILK